ncbi:MAG: OmpA family protein [Muribaculaceae bacterium]|nr:OmpA family protein [Muribaculaceae bacterium]
MKRNLLLVMAVAGVAMMLPMGATAQDDGYVVVEEDVTVVDLSQCGDIYHSSWKDNWFMQMGAGMNLPMLENYLPDGTEKRHITAAYNLGFGKWMTPYLGWRISGLYGAIHWDNNVYSKAKYANANFDLMWDMFNSVGGVNTNRVFSIVPFVGLGGTYTWDFNDRSPAIRTSYGDKPNQWTLPVSAGLQMRFRLCRNADFFIEGRAQFYGDNFNNYAYGEPVDVNITAIGGFTINFGGRNFKAYNPCGDLEYVMELNHKVNELRAALDVTSAALAEAEAQLPCPDVKPTVVHKPATAPAPAPDIILLSTVRFSRNSADIADAEMVNVYNVAEWLKENPKQNIVIKGYADEQTGTSDYNMALSRQRAQNVYDVLVDEYGINPNRLSIQAEGSDSQVYETNDWNRIVIFAPAK